METVFFGDLLELHSGQILTSCGNFSGDRIRARLAYYIDDNNQSARLHISGKSFVKATYEKDITIPPLKKVLNLPGEQHFEVTRDDIRQIFKATHAKFGLSPSEREEYDLLAAKFADNCGIILDQNGLTGSGAVHSLREGSDFDWMIHNTNLNRMKKYVTHEPQFQKGRPFSMEHVYRKYSHLKHVSKEDLDRLFEPRWKYFLFHGWPVSLNFVDPSATADGFLDMTTSNHRITARATIEDGVGSYYSPRIIPVRAGDKTYNLFTWMFLYNGAFEKGDEIEFSGTVCSDSAGNEFILIESSEDFIKHAA